MSSGVRLYIALLHYPVYNKNMDVIATSITNLDIHDIARTSCTYGVKKYFVVHPLDTQRRLIGDILDYWKVGYGATYNPDRKEAFQRVELIDNLETVSAKIEELEGVAPKIITTDARTYPNTVSYGKMRELLAEGNPYLLIFGTGWGIEKETMMKADYVLEPIYGCGEYNHLSVRSAVAIILDRLTARPWW